MYIGISKMRRAAFLRPSYSHYLRNNPTNNNKATNPANPDWPNLLIIIVRLPITFTPKTPLPKRTSDIAPTATKDMSRCTISSIHTLTIVMASFICYSPFVPKKKRTRWKVLSGINIGIFLLKKWKKACTITGFY